MKRIGMFIPAGCRVNCAVFNSDENVWAHRKILLAAMICREFNPVQVDQSNHFEGMHMAGSKGEDRPFQHSGEYQGGTKEDDI